MTKFEKKYREVDNKKVLKDEDEATNRRKRG